MKERRKEIRKFIEAERDVTLNQLCAKFPSWSEMTIRRDLEYLENEHVLIRTKGGARLLHGSYGLSEDIYSERESKNYSLKQEIASKALRFVQPNRGIYIDAGTTMMAFTRGLPDYRIAIITSGPNIALDIAKSKQNPSVVMLGGTLSSQTLSISGASVLEQLKTLNIDTAFMSASGFCEGSGFSVGNQHEADLKRMVMSRARRTIMLMDSSKVGTVLPFTFAKADDVDVFISDSDLPESVKEFFNQLNIEVI